MTLTTHPSTFRLGGDLEVARLGYGSMQLTGPGVWGEPADRDQAIAVLRRAVELGVNFIDTADAYGPEVAENLIHEALHPYEGVVIATKVGFVRTGPGQWSEVGRPEYLRAATEACLRRLGVERIDLLQLHRVDPTVPLADQAGVLKELQDEGKVQHVGLSEVTVAQVEEARQHVTVAAVQNLYNLTNRSSEDVLDYCAAEGIGFIPWFPIATGELAKPGGPLAALSAESGHTPAQLALAWLLQRSPVMLPIPGTSSVAHLQENVAAGSIVLDEAQWAALSSMGASAG